MPGVRFQECDQFEIAAVSECDQSVVSSDGMLPATNHREPCARITRNRGFKFVDDDRNMVDAGEHAVRITKNAREPASDASDYPLDRSSAGKRFEARSPEPGGRSARRDQTTPDREGARPIDPQRQDVRRRSHRETSKRTRDASQDRRAPSLPPESRSFAPGMWSGAARRAREAGRELD